MKFDVCLSQAITSELLFHKPEHPRGFICKFLEQVKVTGTPPLLTKQDLETMFGMFDITKKGVITAQQANAALKSILGPAADLSRVDVPRDAFLKKDEFVDCMHRALHQSAAYKAPS
jgi:hypothetical protein